MNYKVKFPTGSHEAQFETALSGVPKKSMQDRIIKEVENLKRDPYPYGRKLFKKLKIPTLIYKVVAQYRLRIGDYRVLYDVDDKKRIVWILSLRRRDEGTYKQR